MHCVATHPAFHLASESLEKVGDIVITGRHLGNLAERIGEELTAERDVRTEAYFAQPLPREHAEPDLPIALAAVSVDGGRMQTRADGGPSGVEDPHWRETKNALFMRMSRVAFDADPHPELPACFRDRKYMRRLLSGLENEGDFAPQGAGPDECSAAEQGKSDLQSWRPERLFRTCISSLSGSQSFGRMMEAEADSRGFFKAEKRAFVGDGLHYNWTIHARHFRSFTPILDFPHAIERLHETAKALEVGGGDAWETYVRWVSAVWEGRVAEVLDELKQHQSQRGKPPSDCDDQDARKVLAETITYLDNNRSRMDYPRYRREGLPITSAHMESLVKEIGYRVKGSEKFWNDGKSAESILQIRAAALSDDNRLDYHLHHRPGNPFRPNVKANLPRTALAA